MVLQSRCVLVSKAWKATSRGALEQLEVLVSLTGIAGRIWQVLQYPLSSPGHQKCVLANTFILVVPGCSLVKLLQVIIPRSAIIDIPLLPSSFWIKPDTRVSSTSEIEPTYRCSRQLHLVCMLSKTLLCCDVCNYSMLMTAFEGLMEFWWTLHFHQ